MASLGLSVSPGFLLLTAWLYFVGGGAALTACFTAALAHELGHLTAIALTGAEIQGVSLRGEGPVIRYGGDLTSRQETWIVAAGPAAGILFAVLCFLSGRSYFQYTGSIALLAAMFNLLPVLPMDGGRLARSLLETTMSPADAERVLRVTGTLCALGIAITGVRLRAPAAAAAGIWMGVLANAPDLR